MKTRAERLGVFADVIICITASIAVIYSMTRAFDWMMGL